MYAIPPYLVQGIPLEGALLEEGEVGGMTDGVVGGLVGQTCELPRIGQGLEGGMLSVWVGGARRRRRGACAYAFVDMCGCSCLWGCARWSKRQIGRGGKRESGGGLRVCLSLCLGMCVRSALCVYLCIHDMCVPACTQAHADVPQIIPADRPPHDIRHIPIQLDYVPLPTP